MNVKTIIWVNMYFWLKCHNCSRVLTAGGFSPGARSNDYEKEVDKYNNEELHTLELWDSRCSNRLSNAGLSYHNVAGQKNGPKLLLIWMTSLLILLKLTNCQRETLCAAVDLVLLSSIVADCNGPRLNSRHWEGITPADIVIIEEKEACIHVQKWNNSEDTLFRRAWASPTLEWLRCACVCVCLLGQTTYRKF